MFKNKIILFITKSTILKVYFLFYLLITLFGNFYPNINNRFVMYTYISLMTIFISVFVIKRVNENRKRIVELKKFYKEESDRIDKYLERLIVDRKFKILEIIKHNIHDKGIITREMLNNYITPNGRILKRENLNIQILKINQTSIECFVKSKIYNLNVLQNQENSIALDCLTEDELEYIAAVVLKLNQIKNEK